MHFSLNFPHSQAAKEIRYREDLRPRVARTTYNIEKLIPRHFSATHTFRSQYAKMQTRFDMPYSNIQQSHKSHVCMAWAPPPPNGYDPEMYRDLLAYIFFSIFSLSLSFSICLSLVDSTSTHIQDIPRPRICCMCDMNSLHLVHYFVVFSSSFFFSFFSVGFCVSCYGITALCESHTAHSLTDGGWLDPLASLASSTCAWLHDTRDTSIGKAAPDRNKTYLRFYHGTARHTHTHTHCIHCIFRGVMVAWSRWNR